MSNYNQKNDPKSIKLEDSSGIIIDPAIGIDTSRYEYSDTFTDATYNYYVFIADDGSWYSMKMTIATCAVRYVKGDSSYPTSLAACQGLTYNYYDLIF